MAKLIALMTADRQHYVCAEDGGRQPLVANRRAISSWEIFTMETSPGSGIAFQAVNGLWVCAEAGGGGELIANRSQIGPWETFTVVDMGGGSVALRTSNGQFVCAEGGGGGTVVANRDAAGPWESFRMVPVDAGPPSIPSPAEPPSAPPVPPSAGGGFVEHSSSTSLRSRVPDLRFLPAVGGPFHFPAPYGTRGVRLTSDEDGEILPRNYSYWPNVSLPDGEGARLVFVGRASAMPLLLRVSAGGVVTRLGVLPYAGEAEGWYFSARHPSTLYVTQGTRLLRHDVLSGAEETVFDIRETHPGCRLWQAHSSDDGETHSATVERIVERGQYPKLGSIAVRRGKQAFFPSQGTLDECQIDASGRWLVIKEDDDNRIVHLETGDTRLLRNADGAVGHSDCGDGMIIGEDDQHESGALVAWDLAHPLVPERRRLLYHQAQWEGGLGHVAVRGDRILVSNSHQKHLPRLNELLLVEPDGSLRCRVLCPNLIDPATADYDDRPKANLSPDGAVAFWIGNAHGRRDAFMVEL